MRRAPPFSATSEERLIIRPHRFRRISGTASRAMRKVPRAFVAITESHASTDTPSMSPPSAPRGAPATFTRI